MATFKIASTRDLMTAAGEPCFPPAAFDVLGANPEIEWEWLADDIAEITPEVMAAYDGLHVNLPLVGAGAVAGLGQATTAAAGAATGAGSSGAGAGGRGVRCRIIARNGVGYDTVDVEAMTAAGIIVTNTPIAVRRPVAVATLTLIFALAGRLFAKDKLVREGRWNARTDFMGTGLTKRTLGLVGAGSIGQEIMRLARPFFGEMVAFDPHVDAGAIAAAGGRKVDFDEVLACSDFVTVCCLLTAETRHLMNAVAFSRMKPTAYYLNVGRGPIHDEAALVAALRAGQIAGAGLDVTEREPIEPESPLLGMENTIITPHALCWTDECFEDIARTALQSIVDVSLGVQPAHVVNPAAAVGLRPR